MQAVHMHIQVPNGIVGQWDEPQHCRLLHGAVLQYHTVKQCMVVHAAIACKTPALQAEQDFMFCVIPCNVWCSDVTCNSVAVDPLYIPSMNSNA